MAEATGSDHDPAPDVFDPLAADAMRRPVPSEGRAGVAPDVTTVVGAAAQAVIGVHALGSPSGRALVRAVGRIPGARVERASGIRVEVGEGRAAIDISLSIEYGTAVTSLADQVREDVARAVKAQTGLDVVEVDLTVTDVHHPDDIDDTDVVPAEDSIEDADPAGESTPDEPEDAADATARNVGADQPSQKEEPAVDARETDSSGPEQTKSAEAVVVADRVVVVSDEVVVADDATPVVVAGGAETDAAAEPATRSVAEDSKADDDSSDAQDGDRHDPADRPAPESTGS